jgi:transposase
MASPPGVTCRQVALEIGVNPNLLSRWKRELEEVPAKAFKGVRHPTGRRACPTQA